MPPAAADFPAPREGLVETRRSRLGLFAKILRNPLNALPPEVFRDRLVLSRVGKRESLYVCDPSLIQEALVRQATHLSKGEIIGKVLGPALGEGLLTAEGAHWQWQRQSVAAGFQHQRLVGFLPAMIAAAEETRERWLPRKGGPGGGALDIGHEMMRTTFAIIVETMLSGRAHLDAARVERAIADFLEPTAFVFAYSLFGAPDWLLYPGRARARAATAFLRESLRGVVASRRPEAGQHGDLLDMLLQAADPETGRSMADEEVVDNLLTFVTAGHETTALGLAWTFELLAGHPEIEAQLVAEIEAVTGSGPLAPEHVNALPLAKAVFQEAMRLYPPAPVITRQVEAPFDLGGIRLTPGMVLYVPIQAVHRHERLWEQPEAFDPARFFPEQAKTRHRYAYLPFGAGPRICIGSAFATMEAVAILAVLLRAVRLERISARPPEPTLKITLRPKHPLLMRATARR